MCELKDFSHLELTDLHRGMLESELDIWHKTYLPCGETVLDVGAGCGETAQFYLNHGAKRVIAVEGDPVACGYLRDNFGRDNRVIIVGAHLDHIKIDIEGGEKDMLIETHWPHMWQLAHSHGNGADLWKLRKVAVDGCHSCLTIEQSRADGYNDGVKQVDVYKRSISFRVGSLLTTPARMLYEGVKSTTQSWFWNPTNSKKEVAYRKLKPMRQENKRR